MCWRSLRTQTNINDVNKTRALLQTTGGKDDRTSVLYGNRNGHHNTELRTLKLYSPNI
jgi:hypothetical protein